MKDVASWRKTKKTTVKAIDHNNVVRVHVECPDEASNDDNIQRKIEILRKNDSKVGAIIYNVNHN